MGELVESEEQQGINEINYLKLAYSAAERFSDDPATKNGAALVTLEGIIITGANSLPDYVEKRPERLERPRKYRFIEHAERNVIYRAWQRGLSTKGATLYVPWYACCDCARTIIYARIKRVIGHKAVFDKADVRAQTDPTWKESVSDGLQMLTEAGIEIQLYDGPIGGVRNLFDGQYWEP